MLGALCLLLEKMTCRCNLFNKCESNNAQQLKSTMLINYLKIAIRNLFRNLAHTSINVFGLVIGLCCSLLVGVYVIHELSYDKFHEGSENIYRVNVTYNMGGMSQSVYVTPTALLPNILRNYNEAEAGTRLFDVAMFSPVVVGNGTDKFQEDKFFYADSTFFDVFNYQLVGGNANNALVAPASLILTESAKQKYFGNKEAIGQQLTVNGKPYTITAIMADIPTNSHLQFDFLASFSSLEASKNEIWWSANYATFVKLQPNANTKELEASIEKIAREQLGENMFQNDNRIIYHLFPLTDIHLQSALATEMQPQGDIKYVYLVGFIGLLILTIACINYMNLATAKATERAREVGMRKVMGAFKGQLVYQYMGESLVITIISAVLALVWLSLAIAPFNMLAAKQFTMSHFMELDIILGFIGVVLLVGFISGAYPAFSLSSFKPNEVLKGQFKRSKSGVVLRKSLVIVQFTISILLIISTIIVDEQLNFMRNKKLGYDKENVLVIPTDGAMNKNFESIKKVLEQRADVELVSMASESPTEISGGYNMKLQGTEQEASINAITVDKDFVKTMGMNVIEGRDFSEADQTLATNKNYEERTYNFIINEQLAATLMLSKEEAIGRKAIIGERTGEIIGVVEDFHFASLHRAVGPLAIFIEHEQFNQMFIKIKPQMTSETLAALGTLWKDLVPSRPFEFTFMDQQYEALYRSEERLASIFTVFAVMAIFIACLGLLGLVSFTIQQRFKEIGIRKVLGASVMSVLLLISKDFGKLIAIAFILAVPVGVWFMQNWLANFEFKIDIGILPIAFAAIFTATIAFVTISLQSLKAARSNPAETLRSE